LGVALRSRLEFGHKLSFLLKEAEARVSSMPE
jgi:hypothetical protein